VGRRIRESHEALEIEYENGAPRALDEHAIALFARKELALRVLARMRHRNDLSDEAEQDDVFREGQRLDRSRCHNPLGYRLFVRTEEGRERLDGELRSLFRVPVEKAARDACNEIVAFGTTAERDLRLLPRRDVLDEGLHDFATALEVQDRNAYVRREHGSVETTRTPLTALESVLESHRHVMAQRLVRRRAVGLGRGRQVGGLRSAKLADALRAVQAQRSQVAVEERLVVERANGYSRGHAPEEGLVEAGRIRELARRALTRLEPLFQLGDSALILFHARAGHSTRVWGEWNDDQHTPGSETTTAAAPPAVVRASTEPPRAFTICLTSSAA
jgi:hypothetical protein